MAKKKKKKKKLTQRKRNGQTNQVIVQIEQKLNEFSASGDARFGTPMPDYTSFNGWLYEKFSDVERKTIRPTYNTSSGIEVFQYYNGLIQLHEKYKNEVASMGDKVSLKTINKYKLLISATDKLSDRAKEFFEGLQKESKREGEIDEGLEGITAAQLRIRFYQAMEQKKEHIAFKLLGKMKESDLDEGEINYFEALSCFRANKMEEAIRYAERLKENQIDYPSAQAMILESYALLGNINGLKEQLQNLKGQKISAYFFIYLMQLAIMNCPDYKKDIYKIMEIMKPENKKLLTEDSDYLPEFNRHSCQLAIEFIERSQEKDLQMLAYEQHATEDDQDSISIEDLMEDRDEKLHAALALHDQLLEDLLNKEEPAHVIVQYLLNANYEKQEDDFITAFMAQYRLNKKVSFVDNIFQNRKQLLLFTDERIWELFELAYIEAIALNHSKIKEFEKILEKRNDFNEQKADFVEKANFSKWFRNLSPMGKLSYEASELIYSRSTQQAFSWKDAGMVSLGFFRILEVEMNERFIKPLCQTISFEKVEQEINKLKENEEKHNNTIYFWESILKNLKLIQNGKKSGMELGPINHLLGKVKNMKGNDKALKIIFLEELKDYFTTSGMEALQTGKVAAIVNSSIRDRFRNPPAHTKFVPMKIAEECREYVHDVLEQLNEWYIAE